MVSFIQSNAAVTAALLASLATTDAAYARMHLGSRPSMALGSRMLPTPSGQSLFSRDIRRVIHDFDEMFDTVLGDRNEMFYEPFSLQRMSKPSYLLQGTPTPNALAPSVAENAYGITQDDKQLQIVVGVPGANASDINLQLEDDGRLLRISGETTREDGGISMHSRFDRAFTLNRDVDTNKISAQIDNGVLTITAPKHEKAKETVHRINIVENKKAESDHVAGKEEELKVDISQSRKKEETQKAKPAVDESVIDLDEK